MSKGFFSKQLLLWHKLENRRILPWKGEKDPYKIWLSEIILQQTRAEQGLPYYQKFIATYPTVQDLAQAPEQAVFKLWEGLGYYSRCRNLLATAKYISVNNSGQFPKSYDALLQLKGVGPYTAAAIASFAFDIAKPVVDGNVYRVLARFFGISEPFDTNIGKKCFYEIVTRVFDAKQPATFNQAIMDFGASVCTPKAAKCDACYLSKECKALADDMVYYLPVKSKMLNIKHRHFQYWVFTCDKEIYIQQRTVKDIWHQLFEFYLDEASQETIPDNIKESNLKEPIQKRAFTYKQKLTHQVIESHFHIVELKQKVNFDSKNGQWIPINALKNFAFPKTIVSFLEEMHYF